MDGAWLTYAEAAARLGLSVEAVHQRAIRNNGRGRCQAASMTATDFGLNGLPRSFRIPRATSSAEIARSDRPGRSSLASVTTSGRSARQDPCTLRTYPSRAACGDDRFFTGFLRSRPHHPLDKGGTFESSRPQGRRLESASRARSDARAGRELQRCHRQAGEGDARLAFRAGARLHLFGT